LPVNPLPGHIVAVKPLVLSCGSGALELLEVQLEGRKRISGADFANGRHLAENEDMGGPHL
jgi:methionyl-tRNA formyltransferase